MQRIAAASFITTFNFRYNVNYEHSIFHLYGIPSRVLFDFAMHSRRRVVGTYAYPGNPSGQPDRYLKVCATFSNTGGAITMVNGDSSFSGNSGCLDVYVDVPYWVYETIVVEPGVWSSCWVYRQSRKGPIEICPCN